MTRARLDALRGARAAIAAEVRAHVGAGAPHRAPDDAARVERYLGELELGFRGWAQRGATRLLRPVLGAVFAPPVGAGADDGLDARLEVGGDVATVAAVGADALVFAPTHGANLDAIVLGLALERLGLPPALYLAGEHLYRNPLVGRLMGPLGAVRIDRARADRRYLAVLAAYVAALAARGAALTIFPGATRRRDGTLEHDLRLGLIAAAARAAAAQGRRLHVVPVTINLQIVLEAAWLVDYHLRGRGHERVVGDELFVPGRLAATARRLRALDQRAVLRFGAPIACDRRLDVDGLAAALRGAYRAGAVFLDTHVVGRALDDLRVAARGRAIPAGAVGALAWPRAEVERAVAATAAHLDRHPADGARWRPARPVAAIVDGALAAWRGGHPTPAARAAGDAIELIEPRLAWFYANRTRHVGTPGGGGG
ncbi:MAG: 1-acyl-sn-glycerol-3-phosphate acyltransferase [Myxococcales bacterium]|nr:1-acyl-sn-glycerol-3-phosphate acyltransferase [Myxococcales bacterium]MBP6846120.1 1-acyl-sn-glycerol-3-phosphate acyltransferase [Kofleriaceae bacterium]